MSPTSPDVEARIKELRTAPVKVRRLSLFGTMLGLTIVLRFCASAFAGHVSWGRALFSGGVQFLLVWFLSVSAQARLRWAWWVLIGFTCLHLWGVFGHTMRLLRVAIEGGLPAHGREAVFDLAGVSQLVISGVLLWLLFSREVRGYILSRIAEPGAAHEPPPAAAVRDAEEAINPKPESEAPADGGGR